MKKYYCHPSVSKQIAKSLEKKFSGAELLFLEVIENPYLPAYKWTGKWIRTAVMPDDRFSTMVEDLTNPPSWAIHFGLVEKEMEMYVYECDFSFMAFDRFAFPLVIQPRAMITTYTA